MKAAPRIGRARAAIKDGALTAAPTGRKPAPAAGALAEDHIAVLITGLANRLNRGASNYYRKHWDIGTAEWRIILCLAKWTDLSVGEIAEAADLDNAAASRSLKVLRHRVSSISSKRAAADVRRSSALPTKVSRSTRI